MAKDAKWYAGWVRLANAQSADEKLTNLETAEFIENLAAELETVKRERDALITAIPHYCDNCKHVDNAYGEPPCPSREEYEFGDECTGWEWLGLPEV